MTAMSDFESQLWARESEVMRRSANERTAFVSQQQAAAEESSRRQATLDEAYAIGRQAVALLQKHGIPSEPLWGYEQVGAIDVPESIREGSVYTDIHTARFIRHKRIGVGWRIYTNISRYVLDLGPDSISINGIAEDGRTFSSPMDENRLYPQRPVGPSNPTITGLFAGFTQETYPDRVKAYYESPRFQDNLLILLNDRKPPTYLHTDDGKIHRIFE